MEQYISKSALLAEIERLFEKAGKSSGEYRNGAEHTLISINDFLDSLEVKEIQVKESEEIERDKETCKENGDSLTQEPVSEVWHDAQTEQPQAKEKILATNEYGDCEVDFAINMVLYWKKVIKWAYIEDLLNLSNVQRNVKNWEEPVSEKLEKAEKFIDEHTKYCSNLAHYEELNGNVWEENTPWLTPDQARKAVEIAREEVIEQIMAKAIDGVVAIDYYGDDDKTYGLIAHNSFCLEDFGLKDMDKVKMIIIKQD